MNLKVYIAFSKKKKKKKGGLHCITSLFQILSCSIKYDTENM